LGDREISRNVVNLAPITCGKCGSRFEDTNP